MSKRPKFQSGSYFTGAKNTIEFVPTGCTVLDCALGGGYPLGRVTNIVGDRSTAKTALATEALINFMLAYPDGTAAYRESEAAFDKDYAAAMGLDIANVDFGNEESPIITVEDFGRDFEAFLEKQNKHKKPGIYVLDSLDALSDETEMENDIGKGSYGTAKAKQLSTLFRKLARKAERSRVLLLIVSQVRDNIGVMFGEKHKRSGGRALDFYASQIVWLSHLKTLTRKIKKVERPIGISIKAKVKKNKVGLPLREAKFNFMFGYGVDDLEASIDWLEEVNFLSAIGWSGDAKTVLAILEGMSDKELAREKEKINKVVKSTWAEIEESFLPKKRKYT